MTLYFLGGGNMAAAIIAGLRRAAYPHAVAVAERCADKRARLHAQFGVQTLESLPPQLHGDDVLVLAVKPQDMAEACAGVDTGGALVLSIAAGLPVSALSQMLGGTRRIVRIMPNTPAAVASGVSGLYAAEGASAHDRERADAVMRSCGECVWLDTEEQMHAITAVSGSEPAYVFYLLNALQQAAQTLGFSPEHAKMLSLATFRGAVDLAAQSSDDFAVLQQQVTSKGGTTHAALASLRRDDVAQAVTRAAHAAAHRSREMAQTAP
nr:pyrroline-5-carboxylate reductase [Conchiformibius kuhniae]